MDDLSDRIGSEARILGDLIFEVERPRGFKTPKMTANDRLRERKRKSGDELVRVREAPLPQARLPQRTSSIAFNPCPM